MNHAIRMLISASAHEGPLGLGVCVRLTMLLVVGNRVEMSARTFTVLIPARLASTRLPDKPLLDICGLPMIVRVAERAALSQAHRVAVVTDHQLIAQVCEQHGFDVVMTSPDHPSGSDRLAEACEILRLRDDEVVVNVQGDEPLVDPVNIDSVANLLCARGDCLMSTLAAPIADREEFLNPNAVKVVLGADGSALYFSRAAIPFWRDGFASGSDALMVPAPLRHIGLYAYRAGFLRAFPALPQAPLEILESLEQLRALWHGHKIAVHIASNSPGPGVDTHEDLMRVRALFIRN